MRNDLIVFEFEGLDGREILLKPELVTRLATTLQMMFNQARQVLQSEDDMSLGEVEIWLAAVERGCIRLAFRALFHPDGTMEQKEALEASNLRFDFLLKLGALIAGAGAALHMLISPAASDPDPQKVVISATDAENFRHTYEQMLAIGYDSEADRVTVSFPDQTTMILAIDPDLHAQALGSEELPVDADDLKRPIQAELRPSKDYIDVRMQGDQEVRLFRGQLAFVGKTFPVLFRWSSQRSFPDSDHPITIRGRLATFKSLGVRPLKPVTEKFRSARLYLNVEKQLVEE